MNDLVSIVVPVYNVERYLDRCIESIVNQTYRNLEIILVDDGSPDSCPAMCEEWAKKDTRIKVVHKANAGLGEARNTGLQIAAGKYIFFFDSDDYVALNTVERCVSAAYKFEADTVVYGRSDVYPDGTVREKKNRIVKSVYEGEEIRNVFLPGLFDYSLGYGVSAWSKMFITSIFKEHGLLFESERSVISEDSMFSLEYFSKASRVAVIPDKLYYYFKNDESLTRIFKNDRQLRNNDFLNKSTQKVNELRLPEEVSKHIKARYHGMVLGTMMQTVRADLGKKEIKSILRKYYRDEVLRATLKWDVISLDAYTPRIFWIFLKYRCYFLCDLILLCNKRR